MIQKTGQILLTSFFIICLRFIAIIVIHSNVLSVEMFIFWFRSEAMDQCSIYYHIDSKITICCIHMVWAQVFSKWILEDGVSSVLRGGCVSDWLFQVSNLGYVRFWIERIWHLYRPYKYLQKTCKHDQNVPISSQQWSNDISLWWKTASAV